ncbi:DUF2711 family protein [Peribacillus sp. SCS-37]|uniref:DUF2711 family protein n=1 Tax=Paraperibacillus esterisolvens TaxID=3115296 RepID=UPI0039069A03
MLDYIRLNEEEPILPQVSMYIQSAAFLLHPFVQMPKGWERKKRERPLQHIYPNDEEILKLAKPVSWKEICRISGLQSSKEVALALAYNALRRKYKRGDLSNKLDLALDNSDMYWPMEDTYSIFHIKSILCLLGSRESSTFFYSEPLEGKKGQLPIGINPLEISNLSSAELIITEKNTEFAFMTLYDQYTTLFFSKEPTISGIIEKMKWEAVICDSDTSEYWYLD